MHECMTKWEEGGSICRCTLLARASTQCQKGPIVTQLPSTIHHSVHVPVSNQHVEVDPFSLMADPASNRREVFSDYG